MAKVHRYASRVAWRKNSRAFGRGFIDAASFVGAEVLLIAFFALWPSIPLAVRTGCIGLTAGAVTTVIVTLSARLDDPQMLGNLAEVWTAATFKQVKGWLTVHNIETRSGDIDHVVVTPAGVLAVETKFHGYADHERRQRDLAAAQRARTRTVALLRSERTSTLPTVIPALVVWGKGRPTLADGYRIIDGVYLLDGDHPRLWTHLFSAPRLTKGEREEFYAAVCRRQTKHADPNRVSLRAECWSEFREGLREDRAERADKAKRRAALRSRHRQASEPRSVQAGESTPVERPVIAGVRARPWPTGKDDPRPNAGDE